MKNINIFNVSFISKVFGIEKHNFFNAINNNDFQSVHNIIKENHKIVLKTDRKGETVLHKAVGGGYREIVFFLLDNGADINAKTLYGKGMPIHMAAANNESEILELLLNNGADINSKADDGMTPLHYATLAGNEAMVSLLIYKGANVRASTQTACYTPKRLAEKEDNIDMVALLDKYDKT